MSLFKQTRVDARALAVGVLCGAAVGLVVGAAFMIGGSSAKATRGEQVVRVSLPARQSPSDVASRHVAIEMGAHAALAPALEAPGRGRPLMTKSGLFQAAVLKAPAPFHFAGPAGPLRDRDCLTAAVYYEARGETPAGQAAVAQVVLNRVRHPAFPKTVCGVVYQGAGSGSCQFSFACNGAMIPGRESGAWSRARAVAARALAGYVMGDVGRATHFHVASLGGIWGGEMLRVAQVGEHIFYSFGGRRSALGSGVVTAAPDTADPAASAVSSPADGGGAKVASVDVAAAPALDAKATPATSTSTPASAATSVAAAPTPS